MRPAEEVLEAHLVQGEQSCISWTIEFILKLHDKISLTEYPIQTSHPNGTGFGSIALDILDAEQITAIEDHLEWADFERLSRADAASGLPLVFSIPTLVEFDISKGCLRDFVYHGCVAVHDSKAAYQTRQYRNPNRLPIALPQLYSLLRQQIRPDYRVHVLRHQPKKTSIPQSP